MRTSVALILSGLIFMFSCVTQKQPGTKTSALKYNPSGFVLHPKFKVFHESNQNTKLYLKLFTDELRFSSANKDRIKQSLIKVNYKITNTIRSKDVIDSAQTVITLKYIEGQTSMVSFFKIKRPPLEEYFIEVNLSDVYSNRKSQSFIRVDNSEENNSQNYISLIKKNLKPVFNEYFKSNDTMLIKYKDQLINKLYVSYYNEIFEPAEKPYVTVNQQTFKLKADSVWTVDVQNNAEFKASKDGLYIIRADSTQLKGIMKVKFKNSYPLISRSSELIETLRYLLRDNEYEKLKSSDNKKLSIDNYWISIAGNSEKAGELIKIWYNRATYSNFYFTSYKEGWKTDRGIIYMVIGPPDDIQHFNDAEKWIYINTKEDKKAEFIFVQQFNSISNNDFTLIRDNKYEPIWSKALRSWRSGIVFNY